MELSVPPRDRSQLFDGSIVLAGLVGLTALADVGALTAQSEVATWRVEEARVVIEVADGEGAADVRIDYALAAPPDGSRSASPPWFVPFELLGFGDAIVSDIRLTGPDAGGRRVLLWPTVGSHRAASIPVSDEDGDGRSSLGVAYRVEGVVSGGTVLGGRVPLLTGPAGTEEGRVDAFTAELRVPSEWTVSEGFPSGLRRSGEGLYVVSLPVVPAMVGFRARTDGLWRPGFALLVDVVTLCVLLGFAGFGWRHLRGVVARGARP